MNIFKHRGAMGDIIYSIPTINALGGGILHIVKGSQYRFLKNLMALQPHIMIRSGSSGAITHDLDLYREIDKQVQQDQLIKHLAMCHAEAFGVECNIIDPWIEVDPIYIDDIIIARSPRYHDREEINWSLLCNYNVTMIGLPNDYNKFVKKAGFSPKLVRCRDALEIAQYIAGSKLFISNQTLGFAIAEAMKHPRVLEVYYSKNNCQPHGTNGYTYLTEELIGRYLNDK